jgi:hypothetical protein
MNMPDIKFRAKPETVYHMDESVAYVRVKVPALGRQHCDMAAFRRHRRYGSYANSDLFPSMLARAVRDSGVRDYIRLDQLPPAVTVDASGFLATVTITVGEDVANG